MGIWGLMSTAFVVGLSGAMAPGSLLVVVITESVKNGFWAGPAAVGGHAAVELLMTALLAGGLAKALSYPTMLGVVGLIGGIVMMWFGWGTWRTAKTASLSFDKGLADRGAAVRDGRNSLGRTAAAGALASVSNAYWVLWWATVGAAYIAASLKDGVVGPAAFYSGHILSDLAWYTGVSLAVSTGARFLSDKVYRGVLYVCGAFLIFFGLYFIKTGYGFIAPR